MQNNASNNRKATAQVIASRYSAITPSAPLEDGDVEELTKVGEIEVFKCSGQNTKIFENTVPQRISND